MPPFDDMKRHVSAKLKEQRFAPDDAAQAARARMVEKMEAQYGRPQVVLSFGAAEGGALFAQWLREELRAKRGYGARQNAVYLDTIALQNAVGTRQVMRTTAEARTSLFGGKTATGGGLAALNQAWDWYYDYAVASAHTMIFAVTKAWTSSQWCKGEFRTYVKENDARARERRPPLRGIALRFPDGYALAAPHMQMIDAEKVYVAGEARKKLSGNYRDFWVLDPAAMQRLLLAVPPYSSG